MDTGSGSGSTMAKPLSWISFTRISRHTPFHTEFLSIMEVCAWYFLRSCSSIGFTALFAKHTVGCYFLTT